MEDRNLNDIIDALIGDVPVAEQLGSALNRMAEKNHEHDEYVPRAEFDELKEQLIILHQLVGDMSVAEQINMAINK